jgi:hypothetical protein
MKKLLIAFWLTLFSVTAGCFLVPKPSPIAADIRAQLKAAVGKHVGIEGTAIRSGGGCELFSEIAKGVRIRLVGDSNGYVQKGRLYFVSGVLMLDREKPTAQFAIVSDYISKRDKVSSPLEILPEIVLEWPSICGNDEAFSAFYPPVKTPPPGAPPAAGSPGAPPSSPVGR